MSATLLSAWNVTLRAAPDAVAIMDAAEGRRISRAELEAGGAAWHAAHATPEMAGRLVVLCEPNGPGWFHAFLGLLKADAIVALLDPGEPLPARIVAATAIGAGWLWSDGELRRLPTAPRRCRDGRRLLKLTSGSTGTPRAIPFTDAQMLADGRQICAGMDIRPDDLNFGLIPLGHSYGLGNLVVPLLAQGTAVVTGAAALPHAMADAIERWRPTVFPAVPALLRSLAVSDVPASRLASLRTVISAGAALPPDVAQAFENRFGVPVHGFYGSSETGGITYDVSGDASRTGRSVGAPLPGVRLEMQRGGRFTVASAAVFTLGNRGRTPEDWGMHRPADIVALTPEGELRLIGRAGRFVKIAGRRLSLAEVEQALRSLPGVRDAHVIPHAERADALAAAVNTDEPAEALRAALRERLASWKIPKRIVTLPAFPLTPRGKTDTRQLREMLGEKPERSKES